MFLSKFYEIFAISAKSSRPMGGGGWIDRVADMNMLKVYVLDIHIIHTVPKRSAALGAMRLGP